MATMTYVPSSVGEGFFTDFQPPASGATDTGKAWLWNNATGKFEPSALNFDPAGTAAAGDAAHVAAGDPHGGYLLASGARAGAAAQRQAFTNGITSPNWQPASNSTTALQMRDAGGTAFLTGDTINMRIGINTTPSAALHIVTASGNALVIAHSGSGAQDLMSFDSGGGRKIDIATNPAGSVQLSLRRYDSAVKIQFDTQGDSYFNGGNLGIGTTSPNNLLDVAGTIQADGLRLDVTPTGETITPTHTITVSLNGTNYKIPCVAA